MAQLVRFLLFFLMVISLSSCVTATQEGYRQLCESFRGAPEQALLSYWGEPDKVRSGPNGKTLRYNSIIQTIVPGSITYEPRQTYHTGTINGTGIASTTYSGTSTTTVAIRERDSVETTFCLTSFFIDNTGHVADYRFEGPDCVAEEPK